MSRSCLGEEQRRCHGNPTTLRCYVRPAAPQSAPPRRISGNLGPSRGISGHPVQSRPISSHLDLAPQLQPQLLEVVAQSLLYGSRRRGSRNEATRRSPLRCRRSPSPSEATRAGSRASPAGRQSRDRSDEVRAQREGGAALERSSSLVRALSCRVSCCDVMKVSSDRPTYFAYAFREEEKEGSRTAADLLRQTTRSPCLGPRLLLRQRPQQQPRQHLGGRRRQAARA